MAERAKIFDGDDFDVSGFKTKKPEPASPEVLREIAEKSDFPSREVQGLKGKKAKAADPTAKFQKVGHLMHPQTIRQFEMLKAEQKGPGRKATIGPELLHEAMNLLFVKYGKSPVPLDGQKSRREDSR